MATIMTPPPFLTRGLNEKAGPSLRECLMQVEAELVIKIHQTFGQFFQPIPATLFLPSTLTNLLPPRVKSAASGADNVFAYEKSSVAFFISLF